MLLTADAVLYCTVLYCTVIIEYKNVPVSSLLSFGNECVDLIKKVERKKGQA